MSQITPNRTIGQLVAERPSRARIFEKYGIDYCCGGDRTVQEAATQKEIDPQTLIGALEEIDRQSTATDDTDWTQTPLELLIDNILSKHHTYLRRELPRLTEITHKVDQVHGARHPELSDLRETYEQLRSELEAHMMKEERILFPMIQAMESSRTVAPSHCGSVQNPIQAMEHEHAAAGAALVHLRTLTNDYTAPEDGCNTYRAMLDGLAELESDLHAHIHKENNILFPRAAELESSLTRTSSSTTR